MNNKLDINNGSPATVIPNTIKTYINLRYVLCEIFRLFFIKSLFLNLLIESFF